MKRFRHAVPETVNAIIARRKSGIPGLHKVGTDTAAPEGKLRDFLSLARSHVSAEHGIGRLKKDLLAIEFSENELRAMKVVKDALDPEGVLNPGVLF